MAQNHRLGISEMGMSYSGREVSFPSTFRFSLQPGMYCVDNWELLRALLIWLHARPSSEGGVLYPLAPGKFGVMLHLTKQKAYN